MNLKRNNYIIVLVAFCIALTACTKGFEELNVTPDKPDASTVTIPGIFNNLAKDAVPNEGGTNVALFYDITNQQAVQNNTLPTSSAVVGGGWAGYYANLFDYKKLQKLVAADLNKEKYSNVKFMADVLMASRTLRMLDYYGDMPYSEAGLADEGAQYRRPKYDKQADIYKMVLADLKAAADGIKTSDASQISIGSSDSFLSNDYAAWVRFANALRLRYAVRLYGKEQTIANEIITDIIGGNKPLPQNQQPATLSKNNFGFWPGNVVLPTSGFDINDWRWVSFREGSISALRMSTNVWAQMSSTNNTDGSGIFDPRCRIWFQTNNADLWVPQPQNHSLTDGGKPYPNGSPAPRPAIGADASNVFAAFNTAFVGNQKNPYLIITEADVYFLKAEIYQRGMGVAKDINAAKTAYEAGIKSSVDFWFAINPLAPFATATAPTAAEMTAFLATSSVAYNGAADADALKKIATQAWLATMWQPAEAWAIVRRTGLTPKDATYSPTVINKLAYPDDERINNFANWSAASGGVNDPLQQAKQKVYWAP